MTRKHQNPIQEVYFGKEENDYYVRYQQPTSGEMIFITEPTLEMLAEDVSLLNIKEGEKTLLNEIVPEQRLNEEEYHRIKGYISRHITRKKK